MGFSFVVKKVFMRIAVQAADLDADRIDGTRVYLLRLLERFGLMARRDEWHLYHRKNFNPLLTPPALLNYRVYEKPFPFFWTQTRFSREIFRLRPERVFLPVQTLPFFLPKETKSIVTIHDLAFKMFPECFPTSDVVRLNWFTDFAVSHADRLIAVSEATRRDILRLYPRVSSERIRVIHHGVDSFLGTISEKESETILGRFGVTRGSYVLFVGALQPRKNIPVLIRAFESIASYFPLAKLVLAGEVAWKADEIFQSIEKSVFRDRIRVTGRLSFVEREVLYRGANIFVFPSRYEGFGLPILEAFSAGVPVVSANNSSLPEVGGNAALFFDAENVDQLSGILLRLWDNDAEKKSLVERGKEQVKKFSWEICAKETAEWIVSE